MKQICKAFFAVIFAVAVSVSLAACFGTEKQNPSEPEHEHVFGAWTVTKDATCEESGSKERKCDGCDETQSESISALGHTYGEWTIDDAPTESADGTRIRVCGRDSSHVEHRAVSKLGTKGLTFSEEEKSCSVSLGSAVPDDKGVIYLPYEYNGKPVRRIAYEGFKDCVELLEITLPRSMKEYADNVFTGCDNLRNIFVETENTEFTSIEGNLYTKDGSKVLRYGPGKTEKAFTLADSVRAIGSRAFYKNPYLERVELGSGLTEIGYGAFMSCSKLTEVRLSEGLTCIRSMAFRFCSRLKDIRLPASLVTIEERAFEECARLQSITIPESVSTIESCAFQGADNLICYVEAAVVPDGWNPNWNYTRPIILDCKNNACDADGFAYASIGDVYYRIKDNAAAVFTSAFAESIVIPASIEYKGNACPVNELADEAFSENTDLHSVRLPDSITIVGKNVFQRCARLQEVVLPEGLKTIGSAMFYDCLALTRIDLPEGLETIAESAFSNTGLTALRLPSTLKNIMRYAFYGSSALTSMVIPSGVEFIGENIFSASNPQKQPVTVYTDRDSSFYGWANWNKNNGIVPIYSATLSADNSYVVAFTKTAETEATEAAELQAPIREGYAFGGWYTDAACESEKADSFVNETKYFAKWIEA